MIVFDQDLANDKNLWVFNNNIIKFHDDEEEESVYADIECAQFSSRIYPDPAGVFTFNFIEHIRIEATKERLTDNIFPDIDNTVESLIYDDTDNVYFQLALTITITRLNADDLSVNKSYSFFSGVEQLEDYQRQEQHQTKLFALSKLNPRNQLQYHINYWKGYPFDFSIFTETHGDLNIKNLRNQLDIDVPVPENHKVNRIALCDGSDDESIDDFLPLFTGLNPLQITRPGYDPNVDTDFPIVVNINKRESDCGYYIKYRNECGGWAYWLFHKYSTPRRNVSDLDELFNDNNNIEGTVSPTIQTGKKSSSDLLTAYAKNLTDIELWNLAYIIESPKIYLYTGEPYSINQTSVNNQWVEVSCQTRGLDIKRPRNNRFSFALDFKLPERKKVTLI